ncbi:MAG: hypothetical protein IJY74_06610 [Oscillospiraceae bacterium]|nr:hypothetical protein [Oscillospiraceae bacterium]
MSKKNNSGRKKPDKILIGGLCAIGAALLLIGGGILLLFSGNEEETMTPGSFAAVGEEDSATACQNLMSSYYTAIMSEDGESLYKLMAPPEYWDYYMEEYSKDEADIISTYNDAASNTVASWHAQCGDDAKVSFKIEASGYQTDEFLTEWSDTMNEALGEEVLKAEEAMTLSVKQTVTGSTDTVETVTSPTLIKVNGKWYILDEGV